MSEEKQTQTHHLPPVNGTIAEVTNHTITILLGRLMMIIGMPMLVYFGGGTFNTVNSLEKTSEITVWRIQQIEKEIEFLHRRYNTVQDTLADVKIQLAKALVDTQQGYSNGR